MPRVGFDYPVKLDTQIVKPGIRVGHGLFLGKKLLKPILSVPKQDQKSNRYPYPKSSDVIASKKGKTAGADTIPT